VGIYYLIAWAYNGFIELGVLMNIYEKNGFTDRRDYIEQVALTYSLEYETVAHIAVFLGKSEDFDGLLSECADLAGTVVMSVC